MNLEFQKELLQFLAQSQMGKKHIEILDTDVFDTETLSIVYGLLKSFTSKYKTQPSLPNLLEYWEKQVSKSKAEIGKEVHKVVIETIREAYTPFSGNTAFMRETIVELYQIKLMKKVFTDNSIGLKNQDPDIISKVFTEVSRIKKLMDEDDDDEANSGRFALAEFKKGQRSIIEATPTYLHTLNKMTSTRGFYSPQLIIFMGAPKSFKTGTALNLAINLTRDGERVYYVDCENGEDRILDRFYQGMLESTWSEYSSGDLDDVLEEMVEKFKVMGGDFRTDYYPAHTKSSADVQERLEKLALEGWTPTVIIWDYLDLMKCEDKSIKEKRLIIQAVYHDAIRLHKRWGIFGISPSQVNKEAVNKTVIDMTNFSEDFGKAANCHAAFALCRTPDEKEAGVMRIVPVAQRDGVAQHSNYACFVRVDEGKMSVKEISHSEFEEAVKAVRAGKPVKEKPKRPLDARGAKILKDE